jgi:hypothetical protein
LISLFIGDSATHEVNISGAVRISLVAKVQDIGTKLANGQQISLPEDIFFMVEKELTNLCYSDSYLKFLKHALYNRRYIRK